MISVRHGRHEGVGGMAGGTKEPRNRRRLFSLAMRIGVIVAVAGAGVWLLRPHGSHTTSTASPSDATTVVDHAGFVRVGTELRLRQVTDPGNGTQPAMRLEVEGSSRYLTIAHDVPFSPPITSDANGVRPTFVCTSIALPEGGAACGSAFNSLPLNALYSYQEGNRAVAITGVPTQTTIVTFEAGTTHYWEVPVEGLALFPLDDDMVPQASATAVGIDGAVIETLSIHTHSLRQDHLDTRTVVTTAEPAASIDMVTPIDGWMYTGAIVRSTTKPLTTGWTGPFAAVTFRAVDDIKTFHPDGGAGTVTAVWLPAGGESWLEERLGPPTDALRRRVLHTDGGVLFLFSDSRVDPAVVDTFADTVGPHPINDFPPPPMDFVRFVDLSGAVENESLVQATPPAPVHLLIADSVAIGPHQLWRQADDFGGSTFFPVEALGNAYSIRGPSPAYGSPLTMQGLPESQPELWWLVAQNAPEPLPAYPGYDYFTLDVTPPCPPPGLPDSRRPQSTREAVSDHAGR
jgi:hypothetical protein